MKRNIRMIGLLLAALMVVSIALTGCGQKTSSDGDLTKDISETKVEATASDTTEAAKPDLSEEVVLKLYMIGDKSKDMDLVLGDINKKAKEKLNTTLDLQYISWADYGTKYPLVFASGDDFDAIFTADWSFYATQAQKNGFLEITDELLQKNAPNVQANTPKGAWDQVRIKGKVFMIPQLQKEFNQRHFIIRGDLRKKYNIPEIKSIDDLDAYFDIIKKNEKDIIPVNVLGSEGIYLQELMDQVNEWNYVGNNANFGYALYNITDSANGKLFNVLDTPQYLEMLKKVRSWNEKGYIPKSVLTNKEITLDSFKNGKSAILIQNLSTANQAYIDFKQNHPDWSAEIIDGTMGKKVLPYPASSGGLGIHATTKHADRMLMVVDYLRYDKDMNFLAQRGIKGKHWDVAGDGSNENVTKPGPEAANYGDSFTWGPWRNSQFQVMPDPASTIAGYTELFNSLDSRVVNHPLQTFTLDDTNVKNELAALKSVRDQYGTPLELGYVDPVKGLATYKEKLKQAGFDKVMAEMQAQVDAFMQSFSK